MALSRSLSIRTRLTLLAGTSVAGLALFGALAWRAIETVKVGGPHYRAIVQSKDLIADVLPPPAYIIEAYLTAYEIVDAAPGSARSRLIEHSQQLRKDFDTRQAFWTDALSDPAMRKSLLEASRTPALRFFELHDGPFLAAVRAEDSGEASRLLHGPMKKAYEEHLAAIKQVVDLANADYTAIEVRANSATTTRITLMIGVGLGVAVLVLVFGWATRQAVIRPLDRVVGTLSEVASGDLRVRLDHQHDDEVGRMGHSLDGALAHLEHTIGSMAESALTLAGSSEELSSVSQQLGASAEETAAQSNVVSAAAEQVSASIQTVATGAEELSASIREIAKSTADATRVAGTAVQVAEETDRNIAQLGISSTEIGNVVKVITSIAEQTNLLALNATIEAARAGEAGKGFAVVANEVKELAKETAKATEEISRKIGAIQGDAEGAVKAIRQITSIISEINDIQTSIAGAVEEQSATTAEIGRNVTEAAKGSSEIAQNIASVAQAAQSTSSGATQTQASAGELARLAADLQKAVGSFRFAPATT